MVKLRIGLVGTSQMSFPGNKEAAFAACAKALKEHSEEMDFELVVYPETVIVRDDAVRAVKAMEDEKIDFLMVQHTSYSAGQLAPVLAKIHNANVGFWAILCRENRVSDTIRTIRFGLAQIPLGKKNMLSVCRELYCVTEITHRSLCGRWVTKAVLALITWQCPTGQGSKRTADLFTARMLPARA